MGKHSVFKKSLAIVTFVAIAAAFCIVLSASAGKTLTPKEEGLVTTPYGVTDGNLKTPAAESNRYYVVFKSKPGKSDEGMVTGKGAAIRHKFDLISAYSVDVPNATALKAIKKDANVDRVEKVSRVSAFGEIIPWGVWAVKAPLVWDTVTGSGIKVCVLDTGIDYYNPDLDDNYGGGYDFVNEDPDPFDDNGHGTHCAGTVAAETNGGGVVGVAYNATLYSCKVLDAQGSGWSDDILAGIDWAVNNGMHIASLSLGGGGYSPTEEAAYQAAYDAGLLIVCASGNSGTGVIAYPAKYDSNIAVGAVDQQLEHSTFSQYGSELELVAPGEFVLSTVPVGTGTESSVTEGTTTYEAAAMEFAGYTDDDGITATLYYCNFGETPGDFPPGVNGNLALIQRGNISFADKATNAMNAGAVGVIIYNNVPGSFLGTLGSAGGWVPVVSMSNEDGETLRALGTPTVTLINKVGDYDYNQGTSMACPHVAGVAALVFEANDELINVDVRNIMNSTATDLGDPGWDPYYGYGLVNAEAAVEAAQHQEVYMFINNIRMRAKKVNAGVQVYAYVEIRNTEGDPVENATVFAEWAGDVPNDILSKAKTNSLGIAVLKAPFIPPHTLPHPKTITVTVIVTDVVHEIFIYDPDLNQVEPTASITVTY